MTTRPGKSNDASIFVCVENANRSQMAEAFARMHGGDVEALAPARGRRAG